MRVFVVDKPSGAFGWKYQFVWCILIFIKGISIVEKSWFCHKVLFFVNIINDCEQSDCLNICETKY